MNRTHLNSLITIKSFWIFALAILALNSACSSQISIQESPTNSPTKSPTPSIFPSSTPQPTATNTPAPTRRPPNAFQSSLLRQEVSAQSYITDQCQYLAMRWDPENALPGTVVAPIMFHSIRPGNEEANDPSSINADLFYQIIELAENFGFETITSNELIDFLNHNTVIPQRSLLLILDDRKPGTAEKYFLPIMRKNNWTTILAWPIGDTDSRTGLWEQIEDINATGYFDVQAHGLAHNTYLPLLSIEEAREEIGGPIQILYKHFGQIPQVYVWPGGIVTENGVMVAQEAGYEVGFTVYSRGPLQFNSIPLGEEEIIFNNPLMTLPRFWSSAALLNLDQTVKISEESLQFAVSNYPEEAKWYADNCAGELQPLSAIIPSE